MTPDWGALWKHRVRHRFIDHCNSRRVRSILGSESAALQQGNPHCRKIIRAHNVVMNIAMAIRRYIPLHRHRIIPAALVVGEQRVARCSYARKRAYRFFDLCIQSGQVVVVFLVADRARIRL